MKNVKLTSSKNICNFFNKLLLKKINNNKINKRVFTNQKLTNSLRSLKSYGFSQFLTLK